jgi:hypothetical protein
LADCKNPRQENAAGLEELTMKRLYLYLYLYLYLFLFLSVFALQTEAAHAQQDVFNWVAGGEEQFRL